MDEILLLLQRGIYIKYILKLIKEDAYEFIPYYNFASLRISITNITLLCNVY